ncbi:archaeosortase A [Halorarius halobius]|uniref:archaeosortase A n=1 Tax=Halorarius halobius TaxID=2962671 RepID=UPI0020CCAFF2|nr:archaeosortase A [Halorarius halobius]
MPQGPTTLLAWLTVAAFVAGVLVERYDERLGRTLTAGAWGLFAVFWAVLIPHFAFEQQSIIEGVLSAAAVPASAYVGYLLYRGRDTLMILSRGVAVMGLVYLPATTISWISEPLIETVTRQIEWTVGMLGYSPEVVTRDGVRNVFLYHNEAGVPVRSSEILLACTGLGSMAIFVGLIAAVRAPLDRKMRALAVSLPVIWVLNIVRNVFITLAYGHQWFQVFPDAVMTLFGESQPELVSFLVADRIIAQSLSVVALVIILALVVRELPELKVVVEDVLYLVTGEDHDLGGKRPPRGGVRADGGEPPADGDRRE